MTNNHFPDKIPFAMAEKFQKKCDDVKKKFGALSTEDRYCALIEMGRRLPPFPEALKTPDRIVRGCQSILYLHAFQKEGQIYFEAQADALISAGLAALLIAVYSGETPETVIQCPPDFLIELDFASALSPSRSNGLAHIHLRMKQEALKLLIR